MKLTAQDTTYLSSLLQVFAVGGIDAAIIEDGIARGVNEARSCVLISAHNVPQFPQKIGLNKLGLLRARLELFSGSAIIEAKESDRGEVSSLEIASGRNKATFRCTSTSLIKAPKSINDTPACRIYLSEQELKLVLSATRAMACKKTAQLVIRKDGTVQVVLSDDSNDAFTSTLETPAERLEGEADSVAHNYPSDLFATVLRAACDASNGLSFEVGQVGTLKVLIGGHGVTLLPRLPDEDD